LAAVEAGQTDAEIAAILADVTVDDLANALNEANAHVRNSDAALKPVNSAIDSIEKELGRPLPPSGLPVAAGTESIARDYAVARLNYAAQRYDLESRQNQLVAQIYELQVRKSNLSAERHHARS